MPKGAMSANVVRYRSAAFLSSVIGAQRSLSRRNCEPPVSNVPARRRRVAPALARATRAVFRVCTLAVAMGLVACGASAPPEPQVAVGRLADAVKRRDAEAVHAMLDERSRVRISVAEVRLLLDQDGPEIAQHLRDRAERDVAVRADVVLPGGERVALSRSAGRYYVTDTRGLAGVAVTPQEALVGLRQALEHPDYGLLLQLLSSDLRHAVDSQRLELVQALSDVEVLQIVVQGDRAVVNTADGHRVELELESGVWRVRDFE